jgi:hypothetical protein
MRPFILMLAVLGSSPSSAEVKAPFVDGVWATEEGCRKLAELAAGTPRSVETVPETLTADGYQTWEGGCTFTSIEETERGRTWTVQTSCAEGAEEWSDTERVELDAANGRLEVTVDGKATEFVRCEAEKGK